MPLATRIHNKSETWIHFQANLGPKNPPLNRWVENPAGTKLVFAAWRGKSAKSRRTGIKCTKGLNLQGWVLGHPVDDHHLLLGKKKGPWKKIEKTKRGLYKSWMGVDKWKNWNWNLFSKVCGMNEAIAIDISGGNQNVSVVHGQNFYSKCPANLRRFCDSTHVNQSDTHFK